jgi:hypothetical protein
MKFFLPRNKIVILSDAQHVQLQHELSLDLMRKNASCPVILSGAQRSRRTCFLFRSLRMGGKPQISSSIAFALLVVFVLTTLPCTAQTTPTPSAQHPAAAQPNQPRQGKVIFSRSDSEAAPIAPQAPPNPMPEESEQLAAPQVSFTAFDLDVHLRPADQQIAVRALVTIRNDGITPLTSIPLQISSSLSWERIRLGALNIPLHVATINSDADHTGQLHQAIIPLAFPLPPGQSFQFDVTYSGAIALSAQRLQSIGAPDSLALHSDWDQISLPFTGLRGFGNVVWYPVSSTPVMLGDGARLFDEIGAHKLGLSGARFRLRLTVEFPHGQAPTVALINGHSVPLAITEPNSLDQSQEVASVATADSGNTALGFEAPSLFVAIRTPHPGPNLTAWTLPDDNVSVVYWTTAATAVTPFLEYWLGKQPRSPLTLLDLPDPDDTPFETGALLVAPLREPSPKAKPGVLNGVLVHALTHAWITTPNSPASPNSSQSPVSPQPPPAWLNEGVAQFISTFWVEKQQGRDAALRILESARPALALAEPASPGQSPGQPLAAASSPVYYRTKAAYVLWMLRDLAGDPALFVALRGYYAASDYSAAANSTTAIPDALRADYPSTGKLDSRSARYQGTDSQTANKLDSGSALYQGTAPHAQEKQGLVSGHDFSRATSTPATASLAAENQSLVSGHDFSRADNAVNISGALAPAKTEGGGGFNPRIKPTDSTRALAPEESPSRNPFEKLLEASATHPDLVWFFADWVDADKGLPDLTIDGIFPTSASAGNWLVAVNISNAGYAAADVPVTVRSGSGDDARSVTQRLRIPARGKAIQRILIQGKPLEVQVNDGTVPETQASVHITKLEDPAQAPPGSSQSNPPKR